MKPALRLAALALLIIAALQLLQRVSAPAIQQQRQHQAERQLLALLPAIRHDNQPLDEAIELPEPTALGHNGPALAYPLRLNGQLQALLLPLRVSGHQGPIELQLALSGRGRLLAARVLRERESRGLVRLESPAARHWLQQRVAEQNARAAPPMAHATVTSQALRHALQQALRYIDRHPDLLEQPGP